MFKALVTYLRVALPKEELKLKSCTCQMSNLAWPDPIFVQQTESDNAPTQKYGLTT